MLKKKLWLIFLLLLSLSLVLSACGGDTDEDTTDAGETTDTTTDTTQTPVLKQTPQRAAAILRWVTSQSAGAPAPIIRKRRMYTNPSAISWLQNWTVLLWNTNRAAVKPLPTRMS